MTAAADSAIGTAATGQAPATAPPPQGRGGAQTAAGEGRGRGAAGPPVGITVAGEVRNYVPVTDAMLRTVDPGDWLMIRRDYHASNYSPLTQITADNVRDLRLQWIWAMNEGGVNQPAPLVHNGIVYLNNAGNVMLAPVQGARLLHAAVRRPRERDVCRDVDPRTGLVGPTSSGCVRAVEGTIRMPVWPS